MTPNHHPVEDTLLRLAAGRLPACHALVVAVHLPFCPECRAAVRLGEAVGGAFLSEAPHGDLAGDMLGRTLARLDTPSAVLERPTNPLLLAGGVPLPAALDGLVHTGWRWMAPGISRIALDIPGAAPDEHAFLLRVAPGWSLPDHGHHGWEATCVLAGSFVDATGKYGTGDVAETDADVEHQPVAGDGETCVCLIAWHGKLRMRGWLARLVQPLMGV